MLGDVQWGHLMTHESLRIIIIMGSIGKPIARSPKSRGVSAEQSGLWTKAFPNRTVTWWEKDQKHNSNQVICYLLVLIFVGRSRCTYIYIYVCMYYLFIYIYLFILPPTFKHLRLTIVFPMAFTRFHTSLFTSLALVTACAVCSERMTANTENDVPDTIVHSSTWRNGISTCYIKMQKVECL